MTKEERLKLTALDIRRALIMAQITGVYINWLWKQNTLPSGFKNDCIALENKLKAFKNHVHSKLPHHSSHLLRTELEKDTVNDIANLIDLASGIENLSEVVDTIEQFKKQASEATNHEQGNDGTEEVQKTEPQMA